MRSSSGVGVRVLEIVLIALAAWAAIPTGALAWWNDDWSMRRRVTLDTGPSGANIVDPIGRTPVLLRLHDGNFPFSEVAEGGKDLRFVGAEGETPLKFHVETFDPLLGMGFVWVDVPALAPGAHTDLWIYYGNSKAADASDPAGTYDPDTVLVYHFAGGNAPPRDSTAFGNAAATPARSVDGLIGLGARLDGVSPLSLPASPSLAIPEGGAFTWSIWLNADALQPNAVLFSRRDGANALTIGLDQGAPFVEVANSAGVLRTPSGQAVASGQWRHLAVVAGSGQVDAFLDGARVTGMAASLPALGGAATLGGEAPSATVAPLVPPAAGPRPLGPSAAGAPPAVARPGFIGEIDELNISKVARTAGFLRAAVAAQSPNQTGGLVRIDAEVESSGFGGGYLGILLSALTIDGWVVIVILMVMAVVTWIMTWTKTTYVNRMAGGNRLFRRAFASIGEELDALSREAPDELLARVAKFTSAERRRLRSSSLLRLFLLGAGDIHKRVADPKRLAVEVAGVGGDVKTEVHGKIVLPTWSARSLEPTALAAIRARLDAAFVLEMEKLNRWMVIFTIAIAGGPFLGLLGTVVGVMITFAAVAAAGDVNVNAIAPGIAAALMATVAGLFVAIPALFIYNFLLLRIKDIANDMRVFIDEMITRSAEFYRVGAADRHGFAAE